MPLTRVAVLLALLASSCGNKELLVGVVLPETGEAQWYGSSARHGAQLALDAAVAAGAPAGLRVEYRDSGSDPATAARLVRELFDAGALVVIGPGTSAEAEAAIPVADEAERILMSPSASAPDLARRSVFFFRTYPADNLEAAAAAKLVPERASVLVIRQHNPYAEGLVNAFTAAVDQSGGRVMATVEIGPPAWPDQVRETLGRTQPAAVYLAAIGPDLVRALEAVRAARYQGTVCAASAIASGPLLGRAGRLAEGVVFAAVGIEEGDNRPGAREFVQRYEETFRAAPDVYAGCAYDAARATLLAITDLRIRTGTEIQLRLKALARESGVMGPLAFDDLGNIQHYPRGYVIQNGRMVDLEALRQEAGEELRRRREELRRQMEELMRTPSSS